MRRSLRSDPRAEQSFAPPSQKPVSWIALEIANAYPGGKYQDTAVSEIEVK